MIGAKITGLLVVTALTVVLPSELRAGEPVSLFSEIDVHHPEYYAALAEARTRVRRQSADVLRYKVVRVNWNELLSWVSAGETDTQPASVGLFDGLRCTMVEKRIDPAMGNGWTVRSQCVENPDYPSARIIIEPEVRKLFADFRIKGSLYAIRSMPGGFATLVHVNPVGRTRTRDSECQGASDTPCQERMKSWPAKD